MAARIPTTLRRLIAAAGTLAIASAGFIGWRLYEPYRLQREVGELGGLLEFHDHSGAPLFVRPFLKSEKSTELLLQDTSVDDAWLARRSAIGTFPELFLNLSGTRITDDPLKRIAEMPAITGLNLEGTQVTDGGIFRIARLPKLRSLHLARTRVGDRGIAPLRQCIGLQFLHLGIQSTDASLRYLTNLPQLGILSLEGTLVTDDGPVAAQVRSDPDAPEAWRPEHDGRGP